MRYNEATKTQAVKMLDTMGAPAIAKELGITSASIIYYWKKCGYGTGATRPTTTSPVATSLATSLPIIPRERRHNRGGRPKEKPTAQPDPVDEIVAPRIRCTICNEREIVEHPCDDVARRVAMIRHFTRKPECREAVMKAKRQTEAAMADA